MSDNHTHSEFEVMQAYVSVHEFLIEILMANLWATMTEAQVQEMKSKMLDKMQEVYTLRPKDTQPTDEMADFRVIQMMEDRCEHILNKAEKRWRSRKSG